MIMLLVRKLHAQTCTGDLSQYYAYTSEAEQALTGEQGLVRALLLRSVTLGRSQRVEATCFMAILPPPWRHVAEGPAHQDHSAS